MTPRINSADNPLSEITVKALADLGYTLLPGTTWDAYCLPTVTVPVGKTPSCTPVSADMVAGDGVEYDLSNDQNWDLIIPVFRIKSRDIPLPPGMRVRPSSLELDRDGRNKQ